MSSQESQKKSGTIKSATLKAGISSTKAAGKKVAETSVPKLAPKKDNAPEIESLVEDVIPGKIKKASTKTQIKTGVATAAGRKGSQDGDAISDSGNSSSAQLESGQSKIMDNVSRVIESTIAAYSCMSGDESLKSTDADSDTHEVANEVLIESAEDTDLPLFELRNLRPKRNSKANSVASEESQPLTQAGESSRGVSRKGKKTEDDRLSMMRVPVLRPKAVENVNPLKVSKDEITEKSPQKAKPTTSGEKSDKPSAAISKKDTTLGKRKTSSQDDDDEVKPVPALRRSERIAKMPRVVYYEE